MMIKSPLITHIGDETLSGFVLSKGNNGKSLGCVYIHGGGLAATKEKSYEIAEPFLQQDINILGFDFSGHGQSTGTLKKSSLKKRVLEAKAMIDKHAPAVSVMCGASMGGYIAIKLLEFYPVDTLILMCPALYAGSAYEVPFDQGFTEIIRTFESWRNTDILPILGQFTGKVLVIMGEKDEVIPSGVIDIIMQNTSRAKKRELYTIPECPHKINDWIVHHPQALSSMHKKIYEYI